MKQLRITQKVTDRNDASLDKYLNDISKFDLITADEEIRLTKLIREGDDKALEKMIRANLRFVVSVAKQYQYQGLSLTDLINEGNIGLIRAARRFDETKGFKFISYAVWWIRQSIMQALAEYARIVRLPLNKIGSLNKVNQTFNELLQRFERKPTAAEIAKELEMAPSDVKMAMQNSIRSVSMDAPVADDEKHDLHDLLHETKISTEEARQNKASLLLEINRVLSTLDERESEIIKMYFGIDRDRPVNLEEIGNVLGLTRERVRQIKGRAIKIIRLRSNLLRKYL